MRVTAERSFREEIYPILVSLLGAWAVVGTVLDSGPSDPVAFIILLIITCLTAPIKIKPPGLGRPVRASLIPVLAALVGQPPAFALTLAILVLLYETVVEGNSESLADLAVGAACVAISVRGASLAYQLASDGFGLAWFLSCTAAAVAYYFVGSSLASVYDGRKASISPWKIWKKDFLPTGPIFVLAPVGVGGVRLLLESSRLSESILGLVLVTAAYQYLRTRETSPGRKPEHRRESKPSRPELLPSHSVTASSGHPAPATMPLLKKPVAAASSATPLAYGQANEAAGGTLDRDAAVQAPDYILKKQPSPPNEYEMGRNADRPLSRFDSANHSRQVGDQVRRTLEKLTRGPNEILPFCEILSLLGADLNFKQNLQESLQILRGAITCDKAGLFELRKDKYVLMQADGLPDHCISRLSLSRTDGLVAEAAKARAPIVVDFSPSAERGGEGLRYLSDVGSTLAAPLVMNNKVLGAIILCSKLTNSFDERDRLLLELITGKLASTMQSARELQEIYLQAKTDEVTRLPNTRATFKRLEVEVTRAQRDHQSVGVLFMDVDKLKPVNDTYGHAAGDRLLAETARRLKTSLRSYDEVGRVGGDEFLAILPGIQPHRLQGRAERLRRAVERQPVEIGRGIDVATSISVGAAMFPKDGDNPDDLVYISDQRMYRDKRQPRVVSA